MYNAYSPCDGANELELKRKRIASSTLSDSIIPTTTRRLATCVRPIHRRYRNPFPSARLPQPPRRPNPTQPSSFALGQPPATCQVRARSRYGSPGVNELGVSTKETSERSGALTHYLQPLHKMHQVRQLSSRIARRAWRTQSQAQSARRLVLDTLMLTLV